MALVSLAAACAPNTTTTEIPPTTDIPPPRPTQTAPPVPIPSCSIIAIPSVTPPTGALITPPATANTVTVTSGDMGATVFLTTQQHLVVEVGFPGPPAWSGTPQGADIFWTTPQAPYPGPLHREGSVTCPGGSALAVFTAVGIGGTTVAATTDAQCFHTQPPCEMAQQGVEIYVVVRRPQ
jgi:hypothetical protein